MMMILKIGGQDYIESVSKLIKRLDNIGFLGIKNLKRKTYGPPDYDNDIFV